MCSTHTPDCRYDKSIIRLIGSVPCLNTMCSALLCMHKKTFQFIEWSLYHCPDCDSTSQVPNFPFQQRKILFFLKCDQGIIIIEEIQKSFQAVTGEVFCPTCPNEKCVYLSANKNSSFHDCKKCKACSFVLNNPFTEKNTGNCFFGGVGTQCFARKTSLDNEKNTLSILNTFLPPITIKHSRTCAMKWENHSLQGVSVSTPHWLMKLTKTHLLSLSIHVQSRVQQHDFPQRRYWVASRHWTRLSHSHCQRSRPINYSKLSRISSVRLELITVSKPRLFKQPSIASSN